MTDEQPEALRLADELVALHGYPLSIKAAVELRRLHARNAQLLNALEEASDDIEFWGSYASEYFQKKYKLQNVVDKTRDKIKAAKENTQ